MPIKPIQIGHPLGDPAYMRTNLNKLCPSEKFQFFHDFDIGVIYEGDTLFQYNSGSDLAAIDPDMVAAAPQGILRLTAGAGDGTGAVDGSQVVITSTVTADLGGLACEARIRITDTSQCAVFVGFTDVSSLEEPASISGSTITTNASDAVGLVFDSSATSAAWNLVGVAGDTDATGNGATSGSPSSGQWQVVRIEISSDGETATAYVDNVQVGQLTANACTSNTNMYFTVFANGNGSNVAAATVDVDYILVEFDR